MDKEKERAEDCERKRTFKEEIREHKIKMLWINYSVT